MGSEVRLEARALSKKQITYTPDWIRFESEAGQYEITFDIQGEISYIPKMFDCSCKGELIPWVIWFYNSGKELDLQSMNELEAEKLLPQEKIFDIIHSTNSAVIGVYPMLNSEEEYHTFDDTFNNVEISLYWNEYGKECSRFFKNCEVEINV